MSFFGFDTILPRDRAHPTTAPGFGQAPDHFAALSRRGAAAADVDDDDALDFEDTYDGLADELDEEDNAFNDETFGAAGDGPKTTQPVGKDFDFHGATAKVAGAIKEEELRYNRQQPPPKAFQSLAASPPKPRAQPVKTGYEKYSDPHFIPDLRPAENLWGIAAPKKSGSPAQQEGHQRKPSQPSGGKKYMSLEEVEAAMLAQSQTRSAADAMAAWQAAPEQIRKDDAARLKQWAEDQATVGPPSRELQLNFDVHRIPRTGANVPSSEGAFRAGPEPIPALQRMGHQQQPLPSANQFAHIQPVGRGQPQVGGHVSSQAPVQGSMAPFPTTSQPQQQIPTSRVLHQENIPTKPSAQRGQSQPRQILQNPNRQHVQQTQQQQQPVQPQQHMGRGPYQAPTAILAHPHHPLPLSDEERDKLLQEEARRAKRNLKIAQLARGNGLMTPQDKNFITRIQLQQLVAATGNPNERPSDGALSEDFYYHVHSQIRGAPRVNPNQPLSQFAQTYLFQTGGRQGGMGGRRGNRGGDNHVQRMEQQVQRAVAAAAARPKHNQLVLEGSLGKISFSNAKTPKPLLNIKRPESGIGFGERRAQAPFKAGDRKNILKAIENVYDTLLQMEMHDRYLPPPMQDDSDPSLVEAHIAWKTKMESLNQKLWNELKVNEPIVPNSPIPHPFIAIISYAKGKKAMPRVFRHINPEQRLTILTIIAIHLDILDVVRNGVLHPGELQLPSAAREDIDLFAKTIMPPLHQYIDETPLSIIVGLLGIILDNVNVALVSKTKMGISFFTTFVSRAFMLKESNSAPSEEVEQWNLMYNRLFDALEGTLPQIFPPSVNTPEDIYVWQFLAALGVEASESQQQRLVIAVKERVMQTVLYSKTLPPDMAAQKLANVNLFMRAIGLDVDLLIEQ